MVCAFYPCLLAETLFSIELRCIRPNGGICWMQFSTNPRREGSLIVCDGFALNITDRKQAEQRIMVEAGRLESLVNNMHNGSLFCCEIEASVLATIHTPEDLFEKSFAN